MQISRPFSITTYIYGASVSILGWVMKLTYVHGGHEIHNSLHMSWTCIQHSCMGKKDTAMLKDKRTKKWTIQSFYTQTLKLGEISPFSKHFWCLTAKQNKKTALRNLLGVIPRSPVKSWNPPLIQRDIIYTEADNVTVAAELKALDLDYVRWAVWSHLRFSLLLFVYVFWNNLIQNQSCSAVKP